MNQDKHRASDSGRSSGVNCMSSGHGLRGVISRENQETFEERLQTSIGSQSLWQVLTFLKGKEGLTA